MTSGQRNEFHVAMKANTANVARAGPTSGSMIRANTRKWPAPSMNAASSSSVGSAANAWRMRNTPNDETMVGSSRPAKVSTRCRFRISMNSGTMITCSGIIIVARYSANRKLRPRNSMRAKA